MAEQTNPLKREDKKRLVIEMAVLLGVLYLPSELAQLLGTSSFRLGHWSTEEMISRIVLDVPRMLLILYFVYVASADLKKPRFTFDARWDIAIGVLIFCFSRVLWESALTLSYKLPFSLAITVHKWIPPLWVFGLALITIAVSAFYEEMLMRWYVISRLEQIGIRTWAALLASVILFGSVHFYEGYLGMAHASADGLIYGICFVLTRRIWPSVLAHFLWNFILCLQVGHP